MAASAGVSLAVDAASIASNPYNPVSWAKTIGDLWGAFGGGGKQSSVLQGLRLTGTATAGGLSGVHVTAFDQLGNTWDADPAGYNSRWFTEVGTTFFDRFSNPVGAANAAKVLGPNSVPVSVSISNPPQDPNGTAQLLALGQAASDFVADGIRRFMTTTTDISQVTSGTAPTGESIPGGAAPGGSGSGGGSAAPATLAAGSTAPQLNVGVLLVVVGGLIFLAVKK